LLIMGISGKTREIRSRHAPGKPLYCSDKPGQIFHTK
jgi:hypothetical protein